MLCCLLMQPCAAVVDALWAAATALKLCCGGSALVTSVLLLVTSDGDMHQHLVQHISHHKVVQAPLCSKRPLCLAALPCAVLLCAAVTGVLKGYDQLLNLVLDDAVEYLRGELDAQHGGRGARGGGAVRQLQKQCLSGRHTLTQRSAAVYLVPSRQRRGRQEYWIVQAAAACGALRATGLLKSVGLCGWLCADPNDPMRITDDTRTLGVVVSSHGGGVKGRGRGGRSAGVVVGRVLQ